MTYEIEQKTKIRGHVEAWKRYANGTRIKVVDTYNLMTNNGADLHRDLIAGLSSAKITHAALGNSTTSPTSGDTALGAEIIRKAVTVDTSIGVGKVRFEWSILKTEGNTPGTFSEVGLLTATVSGILVTRATFSTIDKDSSVEMDWAYTIEYISG